MIRAPVKPVLLCWARERAGVTQENLAEKFKHLPQWEAGETQPTLKQLEAFAQAVHVPVGYLFLSKPPEESLPIADFRTFTGAVVERPSPNLLDMVYSCQDRQDWYRDFARISCEPEFDFVGSASTKTPPAGVAAQMRETLNFDLNVQQECPNWAEALRGLILQADKAGLLVMVSGVVRDDPHRPLDPAEFRGFALCDPYAPLIFVNAKDIMAAQMFMFVYEIAHIWLGTSALSNMSILPRNGFRREEVWCSEVAAEFLVPLEFLKVELRRNEPLSDALPRLVRHFNVSTLVILRRMLDAGWMTHAQFDAAWAQENARLQGLLPAGDAKDSHFHRTTIAQVGHRFAQALVVSTLEGQTLYRDAFRLLDIRKTKAFQRLGREVGGMG